MKIEDEEVDISINENEMGEIDISVKMGDLICALNYLSHDQLEFLIKKLDVAAADYDFTKRLRDHFIKEVIDEDLADYQKLLVADEESKKRLRKTLEETDRSLEELKKTLDEWKPEED